MKTLIIISLWLLGGTFSALASSPHAWSGENLRTTWKNWSITLDGGVTSYFGDLSKYDLQIPGKLKHESRPAFAIMLNKQFTGAFGVAGQVLYGGLTNEQTNQQDFKTDFIEYNVNLRFNIVEALNGANVSPFGVTLYAGIGQFLFRAVEYSYVEGAQQKTIQNTGVPEFVYFGGGDISYALNDRIVISADVAIRQAQNDKLDNFASGNDFDYYSFSSIGITYRFKDLFGTNKIPNLTRNDFKYGYR